MILDPVTLTVLTIIEANAWGLGHPLEAGKGSRTLSLLSPEESYPIRPTVGLWPPEFSEKKCVLTKTMRHVEGGGVVVDGIISFLCFIQSPRWSLVVLPSAPFFIHFPVRTVKNLVSSGSDGVRECS